MCVFCELMAAGKIKPDEVNETVSISLTFEEFRTLKTEYETLQSIIVAIGELVMNRSKQRSGAPSFDQLLNSLFKGTDTVITELEPSGEKVTMRCPVCKAEGKMEKPNLHGDTASVFAICPKCTTLLTYNAETNSIENELSAELLMSLPDESRLKLRQVQDLIRGRAWQ